MRLLRGCCYGGGYGASTRGNAGATRRQQEGKAAAAWGLICALISRHPNTVHGTSAVAKASMMSPADGGKCRESSHIGNIRTAECIYASSKKVGLQLGRLHPDLKAPIDFSLSLTRVTFASNGRPTLDLSVLHSDTGTVQVRTVPTQSRERSGEHLRHRGLL